MVRMLATNSVTSSVRSLSMASSSARAVPAAASAEAMERQKTPSMVVNVVLSTQRTRRKGLPAPLPVSAGRSGWIRRSRAAIVVAVCLGSPEGDARASTVIDWICRSGARRLPPQATPDRLCESAVSDASRPLPASMTFTTLCEWPASIPTACTASSDTCVHPGRRSQSESTSLRVSTAAMSGSSASMKPSGIPKNERGSRSARIVSEWIVERRVAACEWSSHTRGGAWASLAKSVMCDRTSSVARLYASKARGWVRIAIACQTAWLLHRGLSKWPLHASSRATPCRLRDQSHTTAQRETTNRRGHVMRPEPAASAGAACLLVCGWGEILGGALWPPCPSTAARSILRRTVRSPCSSTMRLRHLVADVICISASNSGFEGSNVRSRVSAPR